MNEFFADAVNVRYNITAIEHSQQDDFGDDLITFARAHDAGIDVDRHRLSDHRQTPDSEARDIGREKKRYACTNVKQIEEVPHFRWNAAE